MAELLQISRVGALPAPVPATERAKWERRARLLAWGGNAWHVVEFAVAIGAGIAAGSIALVGFGADSLVEVLAATVIVWLFTGGRGSSHTAERRAQQLMLRHDGVALEDMSDGMSQGFGFTVYVRRRRFERCGRAKLTQQSKNVPLGTRGRYSPRWKRSTCSRRNCNTCRVKNILMRPSGQLRISSSGAATGNASRISRRRL